MRLRTAAAIGIVWLMVGAGRPATAGRPLITDDAATVGRHCLQLETWAYVDGDSAHHVAVVGFGLLERLELSVAVRHGQVWDEAGYSAAGPLAAAKWVASPIMPGSWPGIALVAGVAAPTGTGGLVPASWEGFGYVAATLAPGDRLLLHGNIGGFTSRVEGRNHLRAIGGVAAQADLVGALSGAVEMVSADPYAQEAGANVHGGFRYEVSEQFQIDLTAGTGLWGRPRMTAWMTAGFRLATSALW